MATTRLEWFGCTTFRLRHGPLTVMLDAYLDRVPAAEQSGVGVDDIDEADWIVVGHSHFDHLWGAERIAARTGARVIASHESVRILLEQGIPGDRLLPVAGGERIELGAGVTVSVFPGLHSALWSVGASLADLRADDDLRGDEGMTVQQIAARQAARQRDRAETAPHVLEHFAAGDQGARGDGGALVFRFELPDGSLLFQDSSGCWSGLLPLLRSDVAILSATARATVDGEPYQGTLAGFVADEVEVLRPKRLILAHHDDWLPGFTGRLDVGPIRDAVRAVAPECDQPELAYARPVEVFAGLSR